MYVNLHTLPADKAMFTAYLTWDDEGTPRSEVYTEEVDWVGPRRSTGTSIPNDPEFQKLLKETYGDTWLEASIVGIVDQSSGYLIFDAFASGLTTDEVTL